MTTVFVTSYRFTVQLATVEGSSECEQIIYFSMWAPCTTRVFCFITPPVWFPYDLCLLQSFALCLFVLPRGSLETAGRASRGTRSKNNAFSKTYTRGGLSSALRGDKRVLDALTRFCTPWFRGAIYPCKAEDFAPGRVPRVPRCHGAVARCGDFTTIQLFALNVFPLASFKTFRWPDTVVVLSSR